jgi:hypothetical protein
MMHAVGVALMNFRAFESIEAEANNLVSAVPPSFLKLSSAARQQQCCERELGYFGQDRFVMFYYEPRGQDVIWADSRKSGFGTGGWQYFLDVIEPMARRMGVDAGNTTSRGKHALIVDRDFGQAYYADRQEAEAFVTQSRRAMSA